MSAPRDRTAARRARPGPLLGATAAIAAVVGLVLGAAGGTHALWSDQITADLGIIQVGPETTDPHAPSPLMCTPNGGHQVTLGFSVPNWAAEFQHFDAWVGSWKYEGNPNTDNPFLQIGNWIAGRLGIDPDVGHYISAEVLVTAQGDRSTVVAQGTVWFHRVDANTILVSCAAPLTATQSPTEGS